MQVAGNLEPRGQTFRGSMLVAEILFVLPEGGWLNVSAEVIKLLWPFVNEFDGQENHAAKDGGQHVPPVSAISAHLQCSPRQHHGDRRQDQNGGGPFANGE